MTTGGLKVARRLVTALVIIATAMTGLFLLLNGFDKLTAEGREAWMLRIGFWEASAGALLFLGLLATARWPRVGTTLIAVGAVVAVATHFWLAVIGVPLAVVIIAAAVIRARTIDSRRLKGA
jgi:peptidoglycan/LPS O-acetylase OafA/YrhL